jgi:RNA polymerase sigma factor (sigma-70 family)
LQKPSSYQHLTDQELLQLYYETRDIQLLGYLLQRYTLLLFGVCFKYLKNEEAARDSVQQIFLKALQEVPRYQVTYIKSWLYMVAKNHCLMYLRDHNKHIPDELQEHHHSLAASEADTEKLQEREKLLQLLEQAMHTLSPQQRICVSQFYLQKKSYKEIADATGYSMLHVKSFIQNGKRNIKLWVEKQRAMQADKY